MLAIKKPRKRKAWQSRATCIVLSRSSRLEVDWPGGGPWLARSFSNPRGRLSLTDEPILDGEDVLVGVVSLLKLRAASMRCYSTNGKRTDELCKGS